MYYVYVLFSVEHGKTYVGFSNNLISLFTYNSDTTKDHLRRYRTWALLHVEKFLARRSAVLREKELRSRSGRAFIKQLIHHKYKVIEE